MTYLNTRCTFTLRITALLLHVVGTLALARLTSRLQLREFGALVGPQDLRDAIHSAGTTWHAGEARLDSPFP